MPTDVTWESVGTGFVATWGKPGFKQNGNPLMNFKEYEIIITNGNKNVHYRTTARRFDFSLQMNRAAFGNPPEWRLGFQIRAVDRNDLESPWTELLWAENGRPAPPTLNEVIGTLEGIYMAWTAPADTDIQGYNVYVSTTPGFTANQNNLYWKGPATSYMYPTSTQTMHYIGVSARDTFGLESDVVYGQAEPRSPFTVDMEAPPVPSSLGAVLNTDDKTGMTTATVTWGIADVPTDLGSFQIRYRPVGETVWNYHVVQTNNDPIVLQAQITHLKPYLQYEFQIQANDFSANHSGWTSTFIASASNNTAPGKPAPPNLAGDTMSLQVTHPNTKADGSPMDADIHHYEVYAHQSNTFVAAATNMIGTIEGPAWIGTFFIPTFSTTPGATSQPWYARVIAVDAGGLKSPMSDISTANTALLNYVNIKDAAITDAKIQSVSANKLVAGTGIINDLTVKSIMTLGDSVTDGVIQSQNYVPGVSGFRMNKNSLEMNTGTISAGAIAVQSGKNIIPYQFSDFEMPQSFYSANIARVTGVSVGLGYTSPRFGAQYLDCTWGTMSANPAIWLNNSDVEYHTPIEGGRQYILSAYVRNSGSVTTSIAIGVRWSDGTTAASAVATPLTGSTSWTRISGVLTAPAGSTGCVPYAVSTTWTSGGRMEIDGFQMEPKETALTTPSPYAPGSMTEIDGGIIRTGEIRSNATVYTGSTYGYQPAWSINMGGYAQFGGASVRGPLVVGSSSGGTDTDQGYSYVQSANYSPGSRGWRISSGGTAEFRSVTVNGIVETSPTGNRVVIRDNGAGTGEVRFFTGDLGESYGFIRVTSNQMQIYPHAYSGGARPYILLQNGSTGADTIAMNYTYANLGKNYAAYTNIMGDVRIQSGTLTVSNRMYASGGLDMQGNQLVGASLIAHYNGQMTFDFAGGQLRMIGRTTFAGMISAPNADCAVVWQGSKIGAVGPAFDTSVPGSVTTRDFFCRNLTQHSDVRLKENLKPVDGALNALMKMPVYEYNLIGENTNRVQYGVLAQDVQKVAPYALAERDSDEEYLSISLHGYASIVGAATRELALKVKSLEETVESLQEALDKNQ